MKGLLVALSLFMGMFNGIPADDSSNVTTTTLLSIAPSDSHRIELELRKCDKTRDSDERNLCYAEATNDGFFCERVRDDVLKNRCYTIIKSY